LFVCVAVHENHYVLIRCFPSSTLFPDQIGNILACRTDVGATSEYSGYTLTCHLCPDSPEAICHDFVKNVRSDFLTPKNPPKSGYAICAN
jgi:hypothetical protein